jgi:hypothetical protein
MAEKRLSVVSALQTQGFFEPPATFHDKGVNPTKMVSKETLGCTHQQLEFGIPCRKIYEKPSLDQVRSETNLNEMIMALRIRFALEFQKQSSLKWAAELNLPIPTFKEIVEGNAHSAMLRF